MFTMTVVNACRLLKSSGPSRDGRVSPKRQRETKDDHKFSQVVGHQTAKCWYANTWTLHRHSSLVTLSSAECPSIENVAIGYLEG